MNYKKWDIILIKFPFTNLTNYKIRPALIISNENFNKFKNIIVIWIYWKKSNDKYSIPINQEDLESWKMLKKSYFRFQNIFSLEKILIERKVWNINEKTLQKINEKLNYFLK